MKLSGAKVLLEIGFRLQFKLVRLTRWAGLMALVRWAYWKARLAAMGPDTAVSPLVVINQPNNVTIGNRTVINSFVHIWGGGGVTIGDDVLIASHVAITSLTHDTSAPIFASSSVRKPVVIENNVWIGAGAKILPGVRLRQGCIVAAGAVVTKDVERGWIVAGVPAKPLRKCA